MYSKSGIDKKKHTEKLNDSKRLLCDKCDALNNDFLPFFATPSFSCFNCLHASMVKTGVSEGLTEQPVYGIFFEMQHCMSESFIYRLLYTICKDFYRAQSRIWYELVFF